MVNPALLARLAIGFPLGWLIVRCAQRLSERRQQKMRRLLAERIQTRTADAGESSLQATAQANGRLLLWCLACQRTAHIWPYGAAVTVAQIILVEQRHLTAMHPLPKPDYGALHDGYYGTGGE